MRQLCQSSLCSSLPAFTPAEQLWGLQGVPCSHLLHLPSSAMCCGWMPHQLEPCGTDGCQYSLLLGAHSGWDLQAVPAHWLCGSGCFPCPWCSCRLCKAQQGVDGRSQHCSSVKGLRVPEPVLGTGSSVTASAGTSRPLQLWLQHLASTLQPTRKSLRQRMRLSSFVVF